VRLPRACAPPAAADAAGVRGTGSLPLLRGAVSALAFSKGGRYLAAVGDEWPQQHLALYALKSLTPRVVARHPLPRARVLAIAVDPITDEVAPNLKPCQPSLRFSFWAFPCASLSGRFPAGPLGAPSTHPRSSQVAVGGLGGIELLCCARDAKERLRHAAGALRFACMQAAAEAAARDPPPPVIRPRALAPPRPRASCRLCERCLRATPASCKTC
jgi:hypothetical protein